MSESTQVFGSTASVPPGAASPAPGRTSFASVTVPAATPDTSKVRTAMAPSGPPAGSAARCSTGWDASGWAAETLVSPLTGTVISRTESSGVGVGGASVVGSGGSWPGSVTYWKETKPACSPQITG